MLCGHLGLKMPRDAFITALCKASLPPHYTLTILNVQNSQNPKGNLNPYCSLPNFSLHLLYLSELLFIYMVNKKLFDTTTQLCVYIYMFMHASLHIEESHIV